MEPEMFTTNRRLAYGLLWLLNHIPIPGLWKQFEIEVITIELDPQIEAEWTPEQRMALAKLLKDSE